MTSSAYHILREDDTHLHESIASFIMKKADAANQGRLCQVLQTYAERRRSPDVSANESDVWSDFPWLTMVFGSGALALPDDAGHLSQGLADAVAEHVGRLVEAKGRLPRALQSWGGDDDRGRQSPQKLAKSFTIALTNGRLGGRDAGDDGLEANKKRDDSPASIDEDAPVDEFAAHLVLLAALLTRLYYTAQQRQVPPVARWDGDIAALTQEAGVDDDDDDDDDDDAVDDDDARASELLIRKLQKTVDKALGSEKELSIMKAVGALLESIEDDLREYPAQLRLDKLRLLTEVSWYYLSLGWAIYSGWTDLLLFLTLRQGGKEDNAGPFYSNLKILPDMVAELHDDPTKASLGLAGTRSNAQSEEGESKRDRLYSAAADVLWAQGDAARGEIDAYRTTGVYADMNKSLPPAVAFVTSFDIELDLAMWKSAKVRNPQSGKAFRVILPLHLVQNERDEFAELCWVMAEIDANKWPEPPASETDRAVELEFLRSPTNWRLVTNGTDETELREMPIIVHLNGCPLYNLPDLSSPDGERLREELKLAKVIVGDEAKLEHAVTIGEYLALRQSEAELIWHGLDRSSDRRLPAHLMESNSRNPRYWLSMGVPVADAAVRHRLVSQLTRERLKAQGNRPSQLNATTGKTGKRTRLGTLPTIPEVPQIGGAAVNLRIGADAAGLLYWAGLDLVQGDCNDLTGELWHYAAHVRDPGSEYKKPTRRGICKLPDTQS